MKAVIHQRDGRVILRRLEERARYRTVFPTRAQARRAVAEYIDLFYNRQRIHSGLGYRTPLEVANEYPQHPSTAA